MRDPRLQDLLEAVTNVQSLLSTQSQWSRLVNGSVSSASRELSEACVNATSVRR